MLPTGLAHFWLILYQFLFLGLCLSTSGQLAASLGPKEFQFVYDINMANHFTPPSLLADTVMVNIGILSSVLAVVIQQASSPGTSSQSQAAMSPHTIFPVTFSTKALLFV